MTEEEINAKYQEILEAVKNHKMDIDTAVEKVEELNTIAETNGIPFIGIIDDTQIDTLDPESSSDETSEEYMESELSQEDVNDTGDSF